MSESIIELSAAELAAKLASGEVASVDAVQAHLDHIEATDGTALDAQDRSRGTDGLNAFLHRNTEEALRVAREVDEARANGEELPELAGVPVAVKDLIVTKGQPTTAASRMLEGFMSPYDGTVTRKLRAAGFGDEVKRRIILGTYALSAGYYDAYYGSAQQVRTLVQRDFAAAFEKADVLISPTAPTTAFDIGGVDESADPMQMYLNDIATIPTNLAGIPALSLPGGLAPEDGLPVGIQFMAPAREDARVYRAGAGLERLLAEKWGGPLWQHRGDVAGTVHDFAATAAQGGK